MTIKEKMTRIVNMRHRLMVELVALQNSCPHDNKTGEYGSNTGNWCPQDDHYWIDATCSDCGRNWTIYSDNPEYRKFDGKVIK